MTKTAQETFTKVLFFWAVFLSVTLTLAACKPEVAAQKLYPLAIILQSGAPNVEITVERAFTRAEQEKGLMGRESMPEDHGMIFTYAQPQRTYFWMKNTLIPLDMIFVDSDNNIIHVHKGAKPHDLTPIPSGGIVRSAIEVNAGIVDKFGISVGDKIVFDNF
jgi:uncharacterized membrane protein (UPF0127 family)|tara:strand:+ start:306 stop:791 length:486 start_codon:yes stop_codon:yes gene_type:complete